MSEEENKEKDGTKRLVSWIEECGNVLLVGGITALIVWVTMQMPQAVGFFLLVGAGFKLVSKAMKKLFVKE